MELRLTTTTAHAAPLEQTLSLAPDTQGVENQVVNLYPDVTGQTIEGFGGAITDAAGYVYAQMPVEKRRQLMQDYFSEAGLGYRIARVPMDSCDFSVEMYEAMSDPSDTALAGFSTTRQFRYILPMLEDAREAAGGDLELMLSPWSPPAFMKDNGERKHGGHLLPQYADMWARYLCRYIREFRDRGFTVKRISVQNEPKAVQTWDSCLYSAEEERAFILEHLRPAMAREGLGDIEIFGWDHNKERAYERARVLAGAADGIACHWYSGDHFEALDMIRTRWPDMKLALSESCIEFSKYASDAEYDNALRLAHELIGDLNHGMNAIYDWNMLLDAQGGPNHVGNFCDAPYLYDQAADTLTPRAVLTALRHFAHWIRPGAVRIGVTRYTDQLDVTAFRNPDGGVALVLLNKAEQELPVQLRVEDQLVSFVLPPRSMTSGLMR
ncbi:MAG: glycoside hydrolase family 30 beta sandwich domain-containing protein [Aristaeellaceae bacterium]